MRRSPVMATLFVVLVALLILPGLKPRRRGVIGALLRRPLPHRSRTQEKQRLVVRPCFVGRQRV
jgi:hypothetical protein